MSTRNGGAVLLMRLADRRAHWPGTEHGVALCGALMDDGPWMAGPAAAVLDVATEVCGDCLDLVPIAEKRA